MSLATDRREALRSARFGLPAADVHIAYDPRWQEGLERVLDGYEGGPAGTAPGRLPVHITLTASREAPGPGSALRPRLTRAARPGEISTRLCTRTSDWDADVHPADGALDAQFALRDFPSAVGTPPGVVARELIGSVLRVTLSLAAPLSGALLAHGAAAVAPDSGYAIAFLGASGSGKTTMTRRLPEWRVLSDDTVWLVPRGSASDAPGGPPQAWVVCGTPLRGREGGPRSARPALLAALVVLVPHSPTLGATRLGPAEAVRALMARVFWCSEAPALEARVLAAAADLVERVPCFALASNLSHDVTTLASTLATTLVAGGAH